jgi:hypothetical protein
MDQQTDNQNDDLQRLLLSSPAYADSRYSFIVERRAHGIEPAPDDAAFEKAYEKQNLGTS